MGHQAVEVGLPKHSMKNGLEGPCDWSERRLPGSATLSRREREVPREGRTVHCAGQADRVRHACCQRPGRTGHDEVRQHHVRRAVGQDQDVELDHRAVRRRVGYRRQALVFVWWPLAQQRHCHN